MTTKSNYPWISSMLTRWFCLGCVAICVVTEANAQEDSSGFVPRMVQQRLIDRVLHRRDSNSMARLVRPIAQGVDGSVVEIMSGGRPVALGTVVSRQSVPSTQGFPATANTTSGEATAFILTKRSELSGDPIRVRLADGRMFSGRVAAVRRRSDLALLVVGEENKSSNLDLTPVRLQSYVPQIGSFLISPDRSGRVIGFGVVGTGPRKVTHQGRLGIQLERIGQIGARVRNIIPDSGADEAGLERGDRIIAIDGETQTDVRQVVSTLNSMYPGEVVQLTIERDGDNFDIPAKMSELAVMQESENDTRVNGLRSARLSGFDQAIQHDTVLNPDQCGGPVLDSQGRVIGINIARAGRVVSYALPSSLVASEVTSMISEASRK